VLHLVFKPLTDGTLLQRLAPGDDVIFLENGIFALLAGGQFAGAMADNLGLMQFFVLQDQLASRGILPEELVAGITPIDYAGWVGLTVKNKTIQSWI